MVEYSLSYLTEVKEKYGQRFAWITLAVGLVLIFFGIKLNFYFGDKISSQNSISVTDSGPYRSRLFNRSYTLSEWSSAQNTANCFTRQGRWKYNQLKYVQSLCLQEPWKDCVGADEAPGLYYDWTVDESVCNYASEEISLKKMCMVMNGETLMIVGDSMSGQFGASFMNRMSLDDPEQCYSDIGVYSSGMFEIRCSHLRLPNFRYVIVRNDRLSLVTKRQVTSGKEKFADFVESPWMRLMNVTRPSLIILNRGAHFESTSKVIKDIGRALKYIFQSYPDTTVIWRNTPRGVENYTATFTTVPLNSPRDPDRSSSLPFHYEEFNKQNAEILKFLQLNFPRVIYWDIAYPMSLREDGHKDPLHYCFPGPMDTWSYMLYNVINIFNGANDIYR